VTVVGDSVAGGALSVVSELVSGTAEVEAPGETDAEGDVSVEELGLHAVSNVTRPALMRRALFRRFTICSTSLPEQGRCEYHRSLRIP
jgi:hypothetical protein